MIGYFGGTRAVAAQSADVMTAAPVVANFSNY